MNQFKKDDLIVVWPGTKQGHNKKVYPIHDFLTDDLILVNFDGYVKLVDERDIRIATPEEVTSNQRDDSIVNAEFHVEQPDIIDLPFVAGLGAEGSYGMSDEQLAQHQQDSQARHSRMCRNLVGFALLVVAAIAGMNWWVA